MAKRQDPAIWLKKENYEYATSYLLSKLDEEHKKHRKALFKIRPSRIILADLSQKNTSNEQKDTSTKNNTKEILEIIRDLEKDAQGLRTIDNLRKALKQKKYRSPDNGKTPKTFTLTNHIVEKLQKLAKDHKKTNTEIIIQLIENSDKILGKHQKTLNELEETLNLERKARERDREKHEIEINEALNQLEIYLQSLATWETTQKGQNPIDGPNKEKIMQFTEKKMENIKFAIRFAAKEKLFDERTDHQEDKQRHTRSRTDW
ncbi:hypothetical protein [Pseudomonas citronellolis]|uniref:hypothetical protein n=1 Tax=Pseudomonas citronellolis TaxID=53408 RepID=UPI0018D8C607|nr:hypothetical protein [Pseudomonas citronellolis]MBH3432672.1 hypothetical protein [Pseudomonas citronellolis]